MNSDGNLFWFVNFIKIKDLVINKDLLQVINAYEYNNETIKDLTFTKEYVERFKNHFQKERFYYTKYWLKYSVKRSENDTKVIPEYNLEQEKIVVRSTIIMILYLLEYRKVDQKSEGKKKKLQAFVDDYILRIGKTLVKRISMESFDIVIQFLFFLSLTKLNNPTLNDFKSYSIENLFIFKILFRILNLVFIEELQDDEVVDDKGIKVVKYVIDFLLNKVIGNNIPTSIQLSNRFLLSHYYYYSHELISLANIIKHIENEKVSLIEDSLSQLLSNIFYPSFNFHSLISPLSEILRNCLLDLDSVDFDTLNRDIRLSSFPIKLFQKMNDNFEELITSGFYFNDNKAGMTLKDIKLEESFSLYFSFFLIPKDGQTEYPIFSFYNKESIYFTCILQKNENTDNSYVMKINKKETQINVKRYKKYKFCIIYNEKTLSILEYNKIKEKISLEIQFDKITTCNIGYLEKSTFSGIIGTIVYSQKKDYDDNRYKTQYDFSIDKLLINKKDKENDMEKEKIQNEKKEKTKDKKKEKGQENDDEKLYKSEDNEWIIHPSLFQKIQFKDNINNEIIKDKEINIVLLKDNINKKFNNSSLKENINLTIQGTKCSTIHINTLFHKNYYSFISNPFYISFLNNEGFSFTLLTLEYYLQILLRKRIKMFDKM